MPDVTETPPSWVLPKPKESTSRYLSTTRVENTLQLSGQLPYRDGELAFTGIVGRDVSLDAARESARLCALNALAVARAELGSLDAIVRIARVVVYVAAGPDFREQPKVADAASEVLVDCLGERGRHARTAIGVSSLPKGAPVEIEVSLACRDFDAADGRATSGNPADQE